MRLFFSTFILFLMSLAPCMAANAYPSRTVTLVVPFAVGSDTDKFAQNLARHVGKYLNQSTIKLDYRPGVSGTLAARFMQSVPADGYTLMIGRVGTQVLAPALDSKLGYRWDSFTNLGILEIVPLICAVKSNSPYLNARDLLAAIRAKPGSVKYSTSGNQTILNFTAQYLLFLSGIKPDAAVGVHLTSGATATEALLDGRVQFVCNNANTLIPHIKSGALRGLFTTIPGRLSTLPQLVNSREAGLRDMSQLVGWTALIGPPNLPTEVITRWKDALWKLASDPGWIAGEAELGAQPAIRLNPDPERFIQDQVRLYDQLITNLGIRQ